MELRQKAFVLPLGIDLRRFDPYKVVSYPIVDEPPLIIWNHRWEFDKNPRDFFDTLDAVRESGLDFRLALLGENFQTVPEEFVSARDRYGDRILQYGYVESKDTYYKWLRRGSVVISTATQENFGISIVEAVHYGCIPLLPCRLSYPEIIPEAFHNDFLYKRHDELVEKLCRVLSEPERSVNGAMAISKHMDRFSWENMIRSYDAELETLARMK